MNLSNREREILILIVGEELSNAEIARRLGISVGTVDTHRKNILAKLNVSNSVGLTKMAIKYNLVKI